MPDKMFGVYDIRGIVGEQLTDKTIEWVAKSFGTLYGGQGKTLLVAHDCRESSPGFYKIFTEALASTGTKVIGIGNVPNSAVYFYGKNHTDGGAYITASHNPKEYNGIKFFNQDAVSYSKELLEIKKMFNEKNFKTGEGSVEEVDSEIAMREYVDYWKQHVKIDSIKCVMEFFHGCGTLFKDYFKEFNIEAKFLHEEPKGDFGGLDPEPKPETISAIQEELEKEEYDFGVAYDGDADRAGFVDEKGNYVMGGPALALLTKYYLDEGDKVVATYDCPSEVESVAKSRNIELAWSIIGHTYIEEKMLEENADLGGEQSSHFYLGKHYVFSDGFAATLLLAEILNKTKRKLSDLMEELSIRPSLKKYIKCPNHEVKNIAMEKLMEIMLAKNLRSFAEDGIKVFLNEVEWVMIRISNTTPSINLVIEGKNKKRLEELENEYTKLIEREIEIVGE